MDLNLCYPCLSYLDLLNNSLHIFAEACKYGRLLDTVDKAVSVCGILGGAGVCFYIFRSRSKHLQEVIDIQLFSSSSVDQNTDFLDFSSWSFSGSLDLLRISLPLLSMPTHVHFVRTLFRNTKADESRDVSLNSLLTSDSQQKFLTRPLINSKDKHQRHFGVSCSDLLSRKKMDRNYNEEGEEVCVVQRPTMSSRFSFKCYRPGLDLRMEGDGAEADHILRSGYSLEVGTEDEFTKNYLDTDTEDMIEFVKNASEVRKLIRLGSFDSNVSSSALDTLIEENKYDFDLAQHYDDGDEISDDYTEDVQDAILIKNRNYKNNKDWWTLTEIENSSDEDSLEWDDEGFETNIL